MSFSRRNGPSGGGSDTLQVTLGRETEKQRIFHCALLREDDRLTGSVFEEMAEVLSEDWGL